MSKEKTKCFWKIKKNLVIIQNNENPAIVEFFLNGMLKCEHKKYSYQKNKQYVKKIIIIKTLNEVKKNK